MDMGGLDQDGLNDSDDSSDSDSDSDSDEEPYPPPPQYPEAIVEAVISSLPPLPSASLIAERPVVQVTPCARRADWRALPDGAVKEILTHLPVSDINSVATALDSSLDALWMQQWRDADLILHDRQIHNGVLKDIKHYMRMHGGVVRTLRVDKLFFTAKNVRSWCQKLRMTEGPSELVLVNRGKLDLVPEDILLPFNGDGIKVLHLCFFTLPRCGLHAYAALAGLRDLGLHGCVCNDEDLAISISSFLHLESLTLSYASHTLLSVCSHSIRELKLCTSSILSLDLRGASALVRLSDLDLDCTALKLVHTKSHCS